MYRTFTLTKSDRHFQVWEYLISHGQLLLRSPKFVGTLETPGQATNIDLVFVAVEYLSLPTTLKGIEFVEPTNKEINEAKKKLGRDLYISERVIVILSAGQRYFIVGIRATTSENDWEGFDSPMYAHHHERLQTVTEQREDMRMHMTPAEFQALDAYRDGTTIWRAIPNELFTWRDLALGAIVRDRGKGHQEESLSVFRSMLEAKLDLPEDLEAAIRKYIANFDNRS